MPAKSHLLTLTVAASTNTEIVYSVGSKCTSLFEQKSMDNYGIHQSDADTILFMIYGIL